METPVIDETMKTLPPETLAAFDNDSLRARVFYEKYALRSSENIPVETHPRQMWQRLARELAQIEMPDVRERVGEKLSLAFGRFQICPGWKNSPRDR